MYFNISVPFDDEAISEVLAFECGVDEVRVNSAKLKLDKDGYYATRSKKNVPALLAMLLLNGRIYKKRNPESTCTGLLHTEPIAALCEQYNGMSSHSDSVCTSEFGMSEEDYAIKLAKAQMFTEEYYGKRHAAGVK